MRLWVIIASISSFLAVLIGAMGAHTLLPMLSAKGLVNFQTANDYHIYHSFALMGCAYLWPYYGTKGSNKPYLKYSALSFLMGILLFSGNLYWLALFEENPFHLLIPVGGTFFLLGWALMALSAYKSAQ